MTLHTDKDLESKNVRGKKFLYKPRISIQKENLKKKLKNFGLKKANFFGSP